MKPVNVFFTGSIYQDCIGNGLFQIIFYTFDEVNLICSNSISYKDKKLILNHAKLFGTKIKFVHSESLFTMLLKNIRWMRFFKIIFKLVPLKIILSVLALLFSFNFFSKKNTEQIIILSPMDLIKFQLPMYKFETILIIADLLFFDFPEQFDKKETQAFINILKSLLDKCSKIISFSNHVKNNHLIKRMKINRNKIAVIPHTLHDFSIILKGKQFDNDSFQAHARQIILNCNKFSKKEKNIILGGNYLLSASTLRKNYKGIETFKYLFPIIHKYQLNLLSTHVPDDLSDDFKKSGNITPKYKLDTTELAAVYVLSKASIHFSFFEGGVNVAPFSEGVSLGTPCIFQRSKAIEEANLDNEDIGMFDASKDLSSLIKQIEKLCQDKNELLQKQISYYKNFSAQYTDKNRGELWNNVLE